MTFKKAVRLLPFGSIMPGRVHTPPVGDQYRFGFQGQEKDSEISGDGNQYTTEFRQYDLRLGRRTSLDPLMASFPHTIPYAAFANNPIYFIDPTGLAPSTGDNDTDDNNANASQ